MGLGEVYALASALVWAIAVVMLTRSGESMGPLALNLFKNSLAVVLFVPTLAAVSATFPELSKMEWLVTVISGFLGIALADYCYLKALQLIGAGRTGIVSSLYSPAMIFLSFVFLGERLSLLQIAGFGAVLSGVLLVGGSSRDRANSDVLKKGMLLALTAIVFMAVGIVMVKRILETHNLVWIIEIRLLAGTAGLLLIMYLTGETRNVVAEYRAPHRWGQIVLAGFTSAYLSSLLWLAGYKYAMASVAAVLNETAGIFIVILAWIFLREPMTGRKVAGVTVTFGGVVLMVL